MKDAATEAALHELEIVTTLVDRHREEDKHSSNLPTGVRPCCSAVGAMKSSARGRLDDASDSDEDQGTDTCVFWGGEWEAQNGLFHVTTPIDR